MKKVKIIQFCILIAIATLLVCCKSNNNNSYTIEDCPIVAKHVITSNGDTLVVCDISLLKDTLILPLSSLMSDFEYIDLEDDNDDALVMEGSVFVSENYIGIFSSRAGGYKLFDKAGKYLRIISSQGQGPNEYPMFIYDSYIDEKNNSIYLLPWPYGKNILVFDLQGNTRESIPLSYAVSKGRFKVDSQNKQLVITTLPFAGTPSVVWIQDFLGNVIQEIPSGHHIIENTDFSNDVMLSLNMDIMDFSLFHIKPENDTLYHYDEANNILRPVFTLDFNGEEKRHFYFELPSMYLVVLTTQTQYDFYFQYIAVDKKTLRGSYVKPVVDILGGIPGPLEINFRRGYYIANMYPHELKSQFQTVIASKDISSEIKDKVLKLNNNLGEDDNNIILLGRLKQDIDEIKLQVVTQQNEERSAIEDIQQIVASNDTTIDNSANNDDEVYRGEGNLAKFIKRTPQLIEHYRYFKENNKYKDWDPTDKKVVKLIFVSEKDGTAADIKIRENCDNTDLDNEAIRLIKEAKYIPGTNLKDEPIRIEMSITVYFPPLDEPTK